MIGSKEEGNDQESIQSNTTPDPGHHMGKCQKHKKNITHKRAKRPALSQQVTTRLQETDKTAWQTWDTNNKNDQQKKYRLGYGQ